MESKNWLNSMIATFSMLFGYDGLTYADSAEYVQLVNNASGLCMDILDAEMAPGTDVIQWACNGGDGQKWNYDAYTGLIRSKLDPRYCLDNGGMYVLLAITRSCPFRYCFFIKTMA